MEKKYSMNEVIDKINKYNVIVLYRHINPDLDALGCQFGMYEFLKQQFPSKHIYMDGEFKEDNIVLFSEDIPMIKDINEPMLGIVMDTANKGRIDGKSIGSCKEIIKIDHHEIIDIYGDINIVYSDAPSCSQIIALMIEDSGLKVSKLGATYLYIGIIGDTDRFLRADMDTFRASFYLLKYGIDTSRIYEKIYLEKENIISLKAYILSHYKKYGNVGYYVLNKELLDKYHITRSKGSDYVSLLGNIEGIKVWLAVTENVIDDNWRVSIRSSHIRIDDIANKYHGGGHKYSSGATLYSKQEFKQMLIDLQDRIEKGV